MTKSLQCYDTKDVINGYTTGSPNTNKFTSAKPIARGRAKPRAIIQPKATTFNAGYAAQQPNTGKYRETLKALAEDVLIPDEEMVSF